MLPGTTEAYHNSRSVSRRVARLLVPIALAMLLFGLLVWPGLAFDFNFKFRLSTLRPNKAFDPDIAASGDYMAAVWSEGYDSESSTKQYGRVYVKGADETDGWKGRVEVFDATQSVWGRDPRLVFDPNVPGKVHIVWAQASGCPNCNWSSIQHTTCMLDRTIVCNAPTTVVSGLTDASTPDVAVDSGGGIHVVWRAQGPSFDVGPVRYCKKGSCGSPSTIDNGQHPSLVYANGYLHLVWDTGSNTNSTIKYSRENNLGNGSWDGGGGSKIWWSDSTLVDYYEPSYPTIGASDDAVYVVWAVRNKSDTSKYALAFDFSQDTGNTWLAGTSGFGHSIPENQTAAFTSTWRSTGVAASDLYSLQPEVVVTGSGSSAYAHVVWHDKDILSGFYQVRYSYLAGYSASEEWTSPELAVSEDTKSVGLPAIALGATLDQTHLVFVKDANATVFRDFQIWYAGSNDIRTNDPDDEIWLPVLYKNS
jgi:hypothetical protein